MLGDEKPRRFGRWPALVLVPHNLNPGPAGLKQGSGRAGKQGVADE